MASYSYIEQVLVKKYDIAPEKISPEATLTDLGLDSLSIAELMFDIEDHYDLDIPDDKMNFTTLGEAAALVDEYIGKKGG